MRNAQGQSYKDFAILYRNNSQADRIANELAKVGIPFVSTEAIKFRYDSWISVIYHTSIVLPRGMISDQNRKRQKWCILSSTARAVIFKEP